MWWETSLVHLSTDIHSYLLNKSPIHMIQITSTETITVHKKIIETILEDLLYLADDEEETTLEATKKRS